MPKRSSGLVNVVTWIAQPGGLMARKGDRHPGITHVWRELGKFSDLANGMTRSANL
ncbi:MAG: hypothetical protein GY820_20840 [Gammaproteobacteria bacterium]|nr:hypothetical protein [Gammaproteobacteria bacterium]